MTPRWLKIEQVRARAEADRARAAADRARAAADRADAARETHRLQAELHELIWSTRRDEDRHPVEDDLRGLPVEGAGERAVDEADLIGEVQPEGKGEQP